MSTTIAAAAAAAAIAAGLAGAAGAWWLHRRTRLSARNLYLAWPASVIALAGAVAEREIALVVAAGVLVVAATVAAVRPLQPEPERWSSPQLLRGPRR